MDLVILRGKYKNEIDHLLINDMSIVENVVTLPGFCFSSDHRLCRGMLSFPKRTIYRNSSGKTRRSKTIPPWRMDEARTWMKDKMRELEKSWNECNIQHLYDTMENAINGVSKQFGKASSGKCTDGKLTEETKKLIETRNEL